MTTPRKTATKDRAEGILDRQCRHVNHFEAGRPLVQQPERTRGVPAGEDETILAGREAIHEIVQDGPEPREALECAQLEELVEEERRRLAAGGPGAREKRQCGVEGRTRSRRGDRPAGERRRARHRAQEPLWRRRRPIDIDVLRVGPSDPIPQLMEQRRASASAASEKDRDARRRRVDRREDTARESRSWRLHGARPKG